MNPDTWEHDNRWYADAVASACRPIEGVLSYLNVHEFDDPSDYSAFTDADLRQRRMVTNTLRTVAKKLNALATSYEADTNNTNFYDEEDF